jgi:hypothetical protein
MSIATLKRKTMRGGNPRLDPVSGIGATGFSLNGGYRNIGAVGQFRMVSNVTRTPFRGTQPMGHGGFNGEYYNHPLNSGSCHTNEESIIKHSSKNTAGLIDDKYKWTKGQYPHYWVKDDDNSYRDTKTQGQLTGAKAWAAGACNFEKAANNNINHCNPTCYGGKKKFMLPYTKWLNTAKVRSQGAYIETGGVARQHRLPTPECIRHYPMMLTANGCDSNAVTWQQAQAVGLLPPNYLKCNPIDYVNCSKPNPNPNSIYKVFNITLNTDNGVVSYTVNGSPRNPSIPLKRGSTYKFVNATIPNQPFCIQTTGNGFNALNAYATGVTESGTEITFAVPFSAPRTLYYQSKTTDTMVGQIIID